MNTRADPIEEPALGRPQRARRQVLVWLAALGGAPLLGGCSEPVSPLRVGTIVFPGYEPMFLARDLGLLDERQVRLVELVSSTDTLRALGAGRLEAAALTIDEVMTARADGIDLRVVLVFDVSAGADAVLARPSIQGLRGLAGKRIGVEDSAMGVVMFEALLAAAQLRVDQVTKVAITVDRSLDVYENREVDALVTFEPWAGRLESVGAVRLFDSRAVPERIVDVLAVRAEFLDSHAAPLRQLVAAHLSACRHLREQPDDAHRRLALRLQLPPADVAQAFRGLDLPDAEQNRAMLHAGGRFDQVVQNIQRLMLEGGLLSQPVGVVDLVDAGFLPGGGGAP